MFENKLWSKVYVIRRDEVTWYWRKLHNGELPNLSSHSVVRVIKLREVELLGRVACMANEKCIQNFGQESLRENTTWEEGAGRIILKWTLGK
jgi:hypothetical protein